MDVKDKLQEQFDKFDKIETGLIVLTDGEDEIIFASGSIIDVAAILVKGMSEDPNLFNLIESAYLAAVEINSNL